MFCELSCKKNEYKSIFIRNVTVSCRDNVSQAMASADVTKQMSGQCNNKKTCEPAKRLSIPHSCHVQHIDYVCAFSQNICSKRKTDSRSGIIHSPRYPKLFQMSKKWCKNWIDSDADRIDIKFHGYVEYLNKKCRKSAVVTLKLMSGNSKISLCVNQDGKATFLQRKLKISKSQNGFMVNLRLNKNSTERVPGFLIQYKGKETKTTESHGSAKYIEKKNVFSIISVKKLH